MELLKKTPVWLVIVLLLAITIMAGYAIADGRRVDFWPPVIHGKISDEINKLRLDLKTKEDYLSPKEVIGLFPKDAQKASVTLTKQETESLLNDFKKNSEGLNKAMEIMQLKLSEVKKVDGTFLYKLLIFNHDTQCYGATLNFTAGKNRVECLSKENLASQFLEFLAEVDFYANHKKNNTSTAKEQLLMLQEKYEFNTKGWYGPDVFKAIINEFYGKA